ncbi:VOC family protein [Nocardia higoensis]|uniref:VOC family protein n=1 Tax=Nocardia higoensis TaxID=228599 RepID=UPI00031CD45D|nr:VOC family protein [Nocardia higoensis]
MKIAELGYIVVGTPAKDEWRQLFERNIGAMVTEAPDGTLRVRLDEIDSRVYVVDHPEDRYLAAGWMTLNRADYLASLEHARCLGVEVREATRAEADSRLVEEYFEIRDPEGNVHEVFWGRTMAAAPFVSPAGVSGFVIGDMGMGHVVVPVPNAYDETLRFYQEVMGFEYSDFFRRETEEKRVRVHFLHTPNSRQHSLAMGELPPLGGLRHFMLEVRSIDDLGRQLDRALQDGLLARTLGRHVNDEVISFYLRTPAGFTIEYGFGGVAMDWDSHEVRNIPVGSYWGHRWL